MLDPRVVAVMLVDGRPEMVERAMRSFRAQTYQNADLMIFDSGDQQFFTTAGLPSVRVRPNEIRVDARQFRGSTIGVLRNAANTVASNADIIVHWDSDDWSHRSRIKEQVDLLRWSGKDCVGYREALFWDTRPGEFDAMEAASIDRPRDEAWIYHNGDYLFVLGTSMCYWRSAWEVCPFDDAPHEDRRWWMKNAARCISKSICGDPRLVCGIHGGNTEAYDRAVMLRSAPEWRRAPEWDEHCKKVMR